MFLSCFAALTPGGGGSFSTVIVGFCVFCLLVRSILLSLLKVIVRWMRFRRRSIEALCQRVSCGEEERDGYRFDFVSGVSGGSG